MAKYSNLLFGIKVLASDNESFNVNEKGYNLVTLLRKNVSRLPKKAEIEDIKCDGVLRNIDNLYAAMVKYHSSTNNTKAERKTALESIITLEKTICDSLGLTLRETDNGEVVLTETITINQYEFFETCFSIRHASKRERLENNNIIDVVTLTTFKKAVLFGLSEACANDGTLYAINGKKAKTIARIEKETEKETNKTKKESSNKKITPEISAIMESTGMTMEQLIAMVQAQAKNNVEKA